MKPTLEPPFPHDASNMAARMVANPEQIERALEQALAPWSLPEHDPDLLAVGAMGGSAIAADLSASLYSDRLPYPIVTVRDYRWPEWVGKRSLALLCSYSGDTEETLALYDDAARRGIARAVITTGGELWTRATADGAPRMRIPAGSPPRAALFSAWVPLTRLLAALGWIEEPESAWKEAAERLTERNAEWSPRVREAENAAKQAARALHRRHITIVAGSERLGAVATRLRNQINENAKLPAHSAVAPELNHNEIVGWERSGPLSDRSAILLLRDPEDTPEVEARLTITAEYAARQGMVVVEAPAESGKRLARIAARVHFGDYLSLYLAMLDGVDPTPIVSIDEFKRRLLYWRAQRVC